MLTVVHIATFEAMECFGKFKVIWDSVAWPNIRYPVVAILPYIVVHKAKLYNKRKTHAILSFLTKEFRKYSDRLFLNYNFTYQTINALLNFVRSAIDW